MTSFTRLISFVLRSNTSSTAISSSSSNLSRLWSTRTTILLLPSIPTDPISNPLITFLILVPIVLGSTRSAHNHHHHHHPITCLNRFPRLSLLPLVLLLLMPLLLQLWHLVNPQKRGPLNVLVIRCDAKLQELLGCESISALGIPEMLERHHLFKKS